MKYLSGLRFMVGTSLVMLMFVAVVVVGENNGHNDTNRLRIENKTRFLTVESVTDLGEVHGRSQFAVTVRNGYDKSIVAYSIRIEDSATDKDTISATERGGLVDDWSIPPKATDVTRVFASSEGNVVLTIFAVMFENGTGEGDPNDLTRLQEVRAGIKLAYQRIAPILRRAASENRAVVSEAAIQSLEDEIASISDREVPMNLRRGFHQAKDYVDSELKDLKDNLRSESSHKSGVEIDEKAKEIEEALAKL